MPFHDFYCKACGRLQEVYFPVNGVEDRISCECGEAADRVWLKAPGIAPDIVPYNCIQLGQRIETRKQRDDILKAKGLELLGPDEYRRTQSQLHARESTYDRAKLKDAFDKAYADLSNGNIPIPETKPTPENISIMANPVEP